MLCRTADRMRRVGSMTRVEKLPNQPIEDPQIPGGKGESSRAVPGSSSRENRLNPTAYFIQPFGLLV